MSYSFERANSLEKYVRKTFHLFGKALHLYTGMGWLERNRSGLCRPVFAGHRDLADAAGIDKETVRSALLELQEKGLIKLTIGRKDKRDHRATSFRRLTLDEIKQRFTAGNDDEHRLAAKLTAMAFRFGNKLIRPFWSVARTGRLCSSKPNVQGQSSADRLAGLAATLKQGFVLVHADIKQAEPSIIKHLLKIPPNRDLYQQYMDTTKCASSEAKKAVNTLSYCRDTLACFNHWPEPAKAILGDYIRKLAAYKETLFAASRRTRAVTTITGRVITAEKNQRLHSGHILNWRVQGSVADVVNGACLRLLDSASVIVPVHDAIYIILPTEQAGSVEAAIVEVAREIGLSLQVKVVMRHAGKNTRLVKLSGIPYREIPLKSGCVIRNSVPITT